MTRATVLKDLLAAFGIALRVRNTGCQDKRGCHSSDNLETYHHADTSGPGFFM